MTADRRQWASGSVHGVGRLCVTGSSSASVIAGWSVICWRIPRHPTPGFAKRLATCQIGHEKPTADHALVFQQRDHDGLIEYLHSNTQGRDLLPKCRPSI